MAVRESRQAFGISQIPGYFTGDHSRPWSLECLSENPGIFIAICLT